MTREQNISSPDPSDPGRQSWSDIKHINPNDILSLTAQDFEEGDSPLVKEAKANARPSFKDLASQTNFYQTNPNITPPVNLDEDMVKNGELTAVPDDFSSALDPITEKVVASHQANLGGMRIGSYIENGELFVYVDTTSIEQGNSYSAKNAAYEYRFNVNMPNAGIEDYGAPTLINKLTKPVSTFFSDPSAPVGTIYRKIFRLRSTLR